MRIRTLLHLATLGLLISARAMAVDYSVAIAPGGLNLYAITANGVKLVNGSPFTLPESVLQKYGDSYPLAPEIVAINPAHNFVSVAYELVPFASGDANDVIIVGYAISAKGLSVQWSSGMNMDPFEFSGISLFAGENYTIVYTKPMGLFASLINELGQQVYGDGSDGSNQLISAHVSENGQFYYSCRSSTGSSSTPNNVEVYQLENGALWGKAPYPFTQPVLVVDSTDPLFVQSECGQ